VVYGRRVRGRTLTLEVSGKLWRNSLVMVDRETGSLWSQIPGEAIAGPLKGAKLPRLAASGRDTTFADWKAEDVRLAVLKERGMTSPEQDVYASYHEGSETGIRARERSDHRLPLKTMVLGFSRGEEAWALPASEVPPGETRAVRLGDRIVRVRNGPGGVELIGTAPSDLEVMKVYWFVWADFHPETAILDSVTDDRTPQR